MKTIKKIGKPIAIILATFIFVFAINLFFSTIIIGNYGVFAHEMYFSGLLFILIFFLFIKPNPKHVFFSPGLMIIWMLLGELILWLFHISIIWVVPLEGDVRILNNLYFSLNTSIIILILFLLLSFIGGVLGIGLSDLIRKYKKRTQPVQY